MLPGSGAQASFTVGGIEIIVARLDLGHEVIDALAASLSGAEQQRAARFHLERDRRRFIAARAQLRELIAARLTVPPQAVELVYGRHGKPALAQGDLQFNLSRSGELAAYAFARGCGIGIDIEAIRAVPDADAIAGRIFSRRENDAYVALEPRERTIGFLNGWTRKEAFVKALGGGLSIPLDSFDVTLAPGATARILRVGSTPGEEARWRLESFLPAPGFVAAVVSERRRLN
ncbi:MAG TPA: 4'-phosphopantetheinyl transferase superfamily protein [Burkholderiales bacterium]|nr:4'-phosphopantetheinyl transferase superfamily protein [Burkholderiales bacterium]